MKIGVTIQLVLFGFGLSQHGWALDRFNRTPFQVENFNHEYKADSDCEIREFQDGRVTFKYNNTDVSVLINGKEPVEYSPIKALNRGKKTFSSCRANGLVGYRDNEFYNDRIMKRTVIQYAGFLCSGGRVKSSEDAMYEFLQNRLVIRMIHANYDNRTASDQTCSLTMIK